MKIEIIEKWITHFLVFSLIFIGALILIHLSLFEWSGKYSDWKDTILLFGGSITVVISTLNVIVLIKLTHSANRLNESYRKKDFMQNLLKRFEDLILELNDSFATIESDKSSFDRWRFKLLNFTICYKEYIEGFDEKSTAELFKELKDFTSNKNPENIINRLREMLDMIKSNIHKD